MKFRKWGLIAVCLATVAFIFAGCASQQTSTSSDVADSASKVADTTSSQSTDNAPFYALIVGNDTRTGTVEITKEMYADGNARSDVMMLVRVDPANYKITLVSVARDTEATIDGQKTKINEAYHLHGLDGAVDAVQQLTGVKIKYAFDMNFVQFESFVDKIGGVTANVPVAMSLQDIVGGSQISLTPGDQQLNGAQALVLARTRKAYVNQDSSRQIQDRQLVQVFIQKALDNPTNVATYVTDLTSCCKTTMPAADILKYAQLFAANAGKTTILSGSGPDVGSLDSSVNLYLVPRDEATWKKIIDVVNAGGDPTTVYPLPPVEAA